MMEDFEFLQYVIEKNGRDKQFIILIEEMSELTKEITKVLRYDPECNISLDMMEEIVDVDIMRMQLRTIMDDGDILIYRDIYNAKMRRLRERFADGTYERVNV